MKRRSGCPAQKRLAIRGALNYKKLLSKAAVLVPLALLFLSACEAKPLSVKPPLEEDGEVYVYLQPIPQEAQRLRFFIESVSAVKTDGSEYPLNLYVKEFKWEQEPRQRLVASGVLPPGSYSGLFFKTGKAFLQGEEGESAMATPEAPVKIESPFQISKQKALLLNMNFKYAQSVKDEFSFSPVFSVFIPGKPVTGVLGFVSNPGQNNVTVFDKKGIQAVGVMATRSSPKGMALDQRARRLYTALSGDDTIQVSDVITQDVIQRVRLTVGDSPQELALTPDGRTLLCVDSGSNTVSVIDTASYMETNRISVGNGPNSILISPDGKRAYVFNMLSNSITVIDIGNKAVVTTIGTESMPLRGQFNRKGDRLYVIHQFSPYMSVIDPASLSVLNKVYLGFGVTAIKVDTQSDFIYIGRKDSDTIDIYDPFSLLPMDFMKSGQGTTYMTIDGDENNLYVVGRDTISVLNLTSKKVLGRFDVGEDPYWVTLMGER